MKAVVVEDELLIKEGLCRLLNKMFPEIEVAGVAGNGQEGLASIEKNKPDLVITDIKMPGMDGLEMLSKVRDLGMAPKVIILTAYSEFTYAQQAVKLGVYDYIIKPVVVQEFVQTIRKIQNLCEQEQKRTPEAMGSLENIISGILHGVTVLDEQMKDFLYKRYGISENTNFIELLTYMGDSYAAQKRRKRYNMDRILQQKGIEYCLIDMEYDRVGVAVIYGYSSRHEIERWYQNQVFFQKREKREQKIGYGMIEVSSVMTIREGYQKLLSYMDWSIVLGDDILISYPQVANIQTEICIYPVELENHMKIAICTGENEKIRRVIEQFYDYFKSGKAYLPKEVKSSLQRSMPAPCRRNRKAA